MKFNLDATDVRCVRKGVTVTMGNLRGVVVKVSRGSALVLWSCFRTARPEKCADLTVEPNPKAPPLPAHIQARARDLRARIKVCTQAGLHASAQGLRERLRRVLAGLDDDHAVGHTGRSFSSPDDEDQQHGGAAMK